MWCSGWKLVSAVSDFGCLGLIGSGSMDLDVFKHHIKKCKIATNKPFGVNLPLYSKDVDAKIDIILQEGVKIVFTSAGNPKLYTKMLKKEGITVAHLISSEEQAIKSDAAGVDALVAEGYEAGGHNGHNETTTLCLIPAIRKITSKPLMAAGGIGTGQGMLSAMCLGADGVQIGTAFAVSDESSAHENFKLKVIQSKEGDTALALKSISPVRMMKNDFYNEVQKAEKEGVSVEEIKELIGIMGRSKKGIFDGDLIKGELEIGQVSAQMKKIRPCKEIIKEILNEYEENRIALSSDRYKYD